MKVQVTQEELEYATGLLNQRKAVGVQLEHVAGVIFQKLDNGCELESGPLGAEIRVKKTATKQIKILYVNGRKVE